MQRFKGKDKTRKTNPLQRVQDRVSFSLQYCLKCKQIEHKMNGTKKFKPIEIDVNRIIIFTLQFAKVYSLQKIKKTSYAWRKDKGEM